MQSGIAIEIDILTGVEHVEAADPKCYGCREQQNAGIERAAHGNPRRGWSDSERKTQHHV